MALIDIEGYPTAEVDALTAKTYMEWENRRWEVFWDTWTRNQQTNS